MTTVDLKPSDEFQFATGKGEVLLIACGALAREIVDLIERNHWAAFDVQCPGAEGEIVTQGPNVMKGYWNLPDATKAAFTADGWFKTGDVGLLDADGYLAIRDRKKDMIIIKGLKVFSAQVEASLLEHPAVEEAAVVGLPDEEGDETIKAFLVLKKGASADKAELMKFAREKLDAYKRPRDIELLEALPKNALQKVLKRELRERELARRQPAKA